MGFTSFITSDQEKIEWSKQFKKKYKKIIDFRDGNIQTKYEIALSWYPDLMDDIIKEVKKYEKKEYCLVYLRLFIIHECGCILKIIFGDGEITYMETVNSKEVYSFENKCFGGCDCYHDRDLKEKIDKEYAVVIKKLWEIIYDYERKYVIVKNRLKDTEIQYEEKGK